MRTKEQWLSDFSHPCYKDNSYEFHAYGSMVIKPNGKEVICFYPIISNDGKVASFIVNTLNILMRTLGIEIVLTITMQKTAVAIVGMM